MKIEKAPLKIVFFGTPYFVIPILESLHKHFYVIGVVTTADTPQGRKKEMTPTPVKQWARDNLSQAIILTPQQFTNEAIEQLRSLFPDIFVTAAYGHLIPQSLLDLPIRGSLNIHPSLLPKYRGPSPIQTAILNGDHETGVSIMEMDHELDHGPIIAQEKVTLNGNETFESLHLQLFQLAAAFLPSAIKQYSNKTITPTPQDENKVVFCKKISKEDGFFDLDNPLSPMQLDRMIRAYYPWPTAWTKVHIGDRQSQIVKFLPQKKVQIEGGKPMSLKDFLNGYPDLRDKIEALF